MRVPACRGTAVRRAARAGGRDEDTVTALWRASPVDSGGWERCRWAGGFYDDDDEGPARPADFVDPVAHHFGGGVRRARRVGWNFHHDGSAGRTTDRR